MTSETKNIHRDARRVMPRTVRHSSFAIRHWVGCLLGAFGVFNSSTAADNPLKIDLVAEVSSITPGRPFYVGLHLQHQPGDHTYWKFPGVVGVPTGIKWELPQGFKAGPIEWPEPQRVRMYQIKAQGYEGEVLLPIKITPPKELRDGEKITLRGQASWMCCGRTCNPGFKNVALELPVAAHGPAAAVDEKWHQPFVNAREAIPSRLAGWKAEARRRDGKVQLSLTAVGEQARLRWEGIQELIFFTDDGLINADKLQIFAKPSQGVLAMSLEISEYAADPDAQELRGVLQTPQGWSPDGRIKSVSVRVKIAN